MAHTPQLSPGNFCWMELGTTDQQAAKDFYGKLFKWTYEDSDMGPSGTYTTFKLDNREVGAGYALNAQQRSMGVPPNWLIYISVANADETAKKIKNAGGQMIMEPFDVMDIGRMAVAKDSAGAVFAIWQAKKVSGMQAVGEAGAFSWADLSVPDAESARKFYEQVFDWKMEKAEKDPSGYLHIKNGEHFIGGVPPAQHRNPNVPPHWLIYIHTDDCDATTAAATKMGAKALVPPTTMDHVGRWSILADPQGAVFAAFQPDRH